MPTHPGVAKPQELKEFVEQAGDRLVVVDLRNPDAEVEPKDQPTFQLADLPSETNRPHGINLLWDHATATMPLPDIPKDTPIIAHCGAGGRRTELAKEFLIKHGFTNVVNGGGPQEPENWAIFGDK